MILPIGHEDGTISRRPWATWTLVALCLLAHLLVLRQGDADSNLEESWSAAAEYALAHPELEADPALLAPLGSQADELRALAEGGEAGDQGHLDALSNRWREAREAHPLFRWGLVPARPTLVALVAHMFLHGGWLHLIGNLLILYLSAPFLEDVWGRPLFTAFYLGAGLFAGGLYALQHRDLDVPLIGASGAVAGVLGAFLLLRGRSRIKFVLFLGFFATFSAPAWVMLPLWFAGELLDALAGDVVARGGGGVAYWAHVWGFVFGVAAAAIIQRSRPAAAAAARAAAPPPRSDPRLAEARKLLDRGLYPRAWELLAAAAGAPGATEEALDAWWSLAAHLGRQREAVGAGRELARRRLREGRWAEALPVIEQLAAAPGVDAELPALELRAAEAAAPTEPETARALLASARGRGGELPPGLQARVVRLEQLLA
jgi:membrane associated rhomboid family serine protease